MPTKAAQTATTNTSQLDGDKGEGSRKNSSSPQLSKLEKDRIIYNKKAESEFFVDNSALAGFTGERILYMAVRELIENSLDSCESFSILPSIRISLKIYDPENDLWILSAEDNGTGINSEKLPVAVCSFLTSAKYMEKQQRGLFGVGLKMVAAFSTKDTDFPIKVWNKSVEETGEYYFELRTDIGTNKPIVLVKKLLKGQELQIRGPSGFRIQVVLRAKLVPITKNKIYEYVSETSIVNPYASLTFETDDGVFEFNRRTSIMPHPAQEILPHPSDMDLKTLKKAISKFQAQKLTLPKILSSSFQKLSYEKAKDIVASTGLSIKTSTNDFSEHDLIKIVNICKKTKFQNPNTDHLSPIGEDVLTIGMMSEYTIVSSKSAEMLPTEKTSSSTLSYDSTQKVNSIVDSADGNEFFPPNTIDQNNNTNMDAVPAKVATLITTTTPTSHNSTEDSLPQSKVVAPTSELLNNDKIDGEKPYSIKSSSSSNSRSNFSVKVLKPVLTAYTSRTCVINNRPTIVETGLAYGGDIPSFKMYRFANKIPLLYDEGSDVAREVISEVEINKMGITKKQAKEQFSTNKESKKDRVIEVLPLHIFFHICSTKIPYKTAGKESIASEGELKYYMKSCLSELYRKLSTQIRKELKMKEAENKLRLYKHYLPFIVESINESLGIKSSKLNESFSRLIESHLSKKPVGEEYDESSHTESHSSGSLSSSFDHITPTSTRSNPSNDTSPFPSRSTSTSKTNTTATTAVATTNSANSNTDTHPRHHPIPPTKHQVSKINSKNSPKDPTKEEVQSPTMVKKNNIILKSNKHGLATDNSKPVRKSTIARDINNAKKISKSLSSTQPTKIKKGYLKVTESGKPNDASKQSNKKNPVQTEKVNKDAEKQIEQKNRYQLNKSFNNFDSHETKTNTKSKNGNSNTAIRFKKPAIATKDKTSSSSPISSSNAQKQQIGSSALKNNQSKNNEDNNQSSQSKQQQQQQLQSTLDSYSKRVNKGKRLR
jgi:DNA topoisomerase-6 subunit B